MEGKIIEAKFKKDNVLAYVVGGIGLLLLLIGIIELYTRYATYSKYSSYYSFFEFFFKFSGTGAGICLSQLFAAASFVFFQGDF